MLAAKRQLGFTLLELLVSISLTSVILMILLAGLGVTQRAWDRGNDKLASIEQHLSENEALQTQMSSAVPRILNTQREQRPIQLLSFQGDATEMRFLSNYSWEGNRNFGQWLVSYWVAQASDGKVQLKVSETGLTQDQQIPGFMLSKKLTGIQSRTFGEDADQIEISFLRPSSPGLPPAWVQEWNCLKQKQLPRGVRIRWQSVKQVQELLLVLPVREEAQ